MTATHFIKEVRRRLPGGIYYKNIQEMKRAAVNKNSEGFELWQLFLEECKVSYLKGKFGKNEPADRIRELVQTVDGYDFGIIKLPQNEHIMKDMFSELRDLIMPYIFDLSPSFGLEGTYENFGVKVEEGDVVIDAGTNIGVFTSFCAAYRKASRVYSFEPIPYVVDILKKTISLNNIEDKVVIIEKGLSDKNEYVEFELSNNIGGSSFMSGVKESRHAKETVEVITLDDFAIENKIEKIDFIKADIEGAERFMLRGASEVLKTHKPKLAICTYHFPEDPKLLEEIILDANPSYKINHTKFKLFAE